MIDGQSPETAITLTLPAAGFGIRRIVADDHQVGVARNHSGEWRGELWPVADQPPESPVDTVERWGLTELRAELRRRLDEDGPWWTVREENESG